MFGSNQNSSGFGANSNQAGSLFGKAATSNTGFGGFGANNNTTNAAGGLFGSTSNAPQSSGATTGGFGFGSSSAPNTAGFGSSSAPNTVGFGATSNTGFGANNASTSGGFGAAGFGSTSNAAFGANTASTSGGFGSAGFGGLNKPATSAAGTLFGSTATNPSQPTYGFGQTSTSAAPSTGFGIGASGSSFSFGTNNAATNSGTSLFGGNKPATSLTLTNAAKPFSFGSNTGTNTFGAAPSLGLGTSAFGAGVANNAQAPGVFSSLNINKTTQPTIGNNDSILIDPKTNQRINVDSKTLFSDLPPNAQKLLLDVEQYIYQQKSLSNELKSVTEQTNKLLSNCQQEFKDVESQTTYLKQDLQSNHTQVQQHQNQLNHQTKDFQLIYRNLNELQNGSYSYNNRTNENDDTVDYFYSTTDEFETRINDSLQTLQRLTQQIYSLSQTSNLPYTDIIQDALNSQHSVIGGLTNKVLQNHQTVMQQKLANDKLQALSIHKQ